MDAMKKCAYCAENIQVAATVCRYCGQELTQAAPLNAPQGASQPQRFDAKKTDISGPVSVFLLLLGGWWLFFGGGKALLFGSDTPPAATVQSAGAELSPPLLSEVSTFLAEHSEFGTPTATQSVDDWARGSRQRVTFDSGRNLLFYTEGGRVVTVYEDDGEEGRRKVWGE